MTMLLTLPADRNWGEPEQWLAPVIPFPSGKRKAAPHTGFYGEVVVQFLVEPKKSDRLVRVFKQFSFIDSSGYEWIVPEGAILNGASIPRFLWTFYGSPYTGDYRRASLVHDYAYFSRIQHKKFADDAFYDAMVIDHVRIGKARNMRRMVQWFGPDWEVAV